MNSNSKPLDATQCYTRCREDAETANVKGATSVLAEYFPE